MGNVALIEFNSYHDECLYSQLKFLTEAGHTVTLVINHKLDARTNEYQHLAKECIIIKPASLQNFLTRVRFVYQLKKRLQKQGIHTVVFNTASSRMEVILLSFLLKNKIALFGILHNLKKVNHSFSQKLINKSIKKYFVLNDFLKDSAELEDKSLQLQSFYPIFFPKYEAKIPEKPKGEIWISIPGKLDFGRRDYILIAEALRKLQSKSNLKILILGNADAENPTNKEFIDSLQNHGLHNNFMMFHSFLDHGTFHQYIKDSDYILIPLNTVGTNYSKYKIMGCYNQAFGYGINLISPVGLKHIPDIMAHSIFYDGAEGLSKVFEELSNGSIQNKSKPYNEDKWSFESQKNRYIGFLENIKKN
ncbi:hypothetical protein [Flagellimonas crocea]|uniref:hypothetical protein n=1 Tax=Flagellimonas crocea TaxID=3067311 RepID=UPI00296E547C|nr:hypothetical protein [Muricauda sp. DH64]